jgi:hypothetical protein
MYTSAMRDFSLRTPCPLCAPCETRVQGCVGVIDLCAIILLQKFLRIGIYGREHELRAEYDGTCQVGPAINGKIINIGIFLALCHNVVPEPSVGLLFSSTAC